MKATDIYQVLGKCVLIGDPDREVTGIAPVTSAVAGDLAFCREGWIAEAAKKRGCIIIMPYDAYKKASLENTLLLVDNPRLAFARALELFVSRNSILCQDDFKIDPSAKIHPTVIMEGKVTIGKNVSIRAFCAIGIPGFSYERDEVGELMYVPQVGGVTIGDDVAIAAHSSVHRGSLDDTIIGKGSKISVNCNIGHNVVVEKHVYIAGTCYFGGKTRIGDYSFIGMGTVTKPRIIIGCNTVVGVGSVVTRDIPDNAVAFGNPARVKEKT